MNPPAYFTDTRTILYHGDSRELLKPEMGGMGIGSAGADLLLTDPPYGISYESGFRREGDPMGKPVANDSDLGVVEQVLRLAYARLAEDRHWYVFASPQNLLPMLEVLQRVGMETRQILCWDKGDFGGPGDLECGYIQGWEAILYGMKGRRPFFGKRPRSPIRVDWTARLDPVHPCVKPRELLSRLIEPSTKDGEVILDPFAGSGSTLLAARNMGRMSVGIELDPEHCETARARLSQLALW